MATVYAVLRENKTNAEGTAPVYLRISDAHRTRYVSLGIRVGPRYWNPKTHRVRPAHRKAEEYNKLITDAVMATEDEVLRLKLRGERATADGLKGAVTAAAEGEDFFAFADAFVAELERAKQERYRRKAASVVKKLRAFTGTPLPFDQLTPGLLRRYQSYLLEDLGNAPNTIVANFAVLRTITRRAVREDHMDVGANPFLKFSPVRQTRPERAKLSSEDIRALEAVSLPLGGALDVTRDAFLFSFYCAGVRFGDVALLRWRNVRRDGEGERVEYTMGKTGAARSLMLFPEARAILDKYRTCGPPGPGTLVFPLLQGYDLSDPALVVSAVSSRNATANLLLKDLAALAEIDAHLTFHVSRHSFADLARRRGADVYKISKALGHTSLKVTQTYLSGFDDGAADEVMADVFGAVRSAATG